jgi:hypothetical protein
LTGSPRVSSTKTARRSAPMLVHPIATQSAEVGTHHGAELARVDDWNAAISAVMGGRIMLVTSGFFLALDFPRNSA